MPSIRWLSASFRALAARSGFMFGARSAASLTRAVESISATFQPDQPFALIPLQVCASRTESHSTWLAAVYSNHHSLFQRSATEKVVSDSPAAFSFAHLKLIEWFMFCFVCFFQKKKKIAIKHSSHICKKWLEQH